MINKIDNFKEFNNKKCNYTIKKNDDEEATIIFYNINEIDNFVKYIDKIVNDFLILCKMTMRLILQ